jgi:hypothetical protein
MIVLVQSGRTSKLRNDLKSVVDVRRFNNPTFIGHKFPPFCYTEKVRFVILASEAPELRAPPFGSGLHALRAEQHIVRQLHGSTHFVVATVTDTATLTPALHRNCSEVQRPNRPSGRHRSQACQVRSPQQRPKRYAKTPETNTQRIGTRTVLDAKESCERQ